MRKIQITNPILDRTYRTYITSDYSSGTSVTVANNTSFAANDYLVFGEPREELTEGKKLDSITGSTTLTINSALNFAHGKNTPVYKSPWDQISIEYKAVSTDSWAVLSTSAIQWDNKDNETVYYHSAATSAYSYRFRFYNSISATYSEYSTTLTGATPARNSVRYMIDTVRKITQDQEAKIVTDDEIIRAFNSAQDIIYAHNPKYWFLLVDTYKGSNGIAATAAEDTYSLATYTTLGHLESLRYKYTSGATSEIYHLNGIAKIEMDELMRDLNASGTDWPRHYTLLPADSSSDKGYFQVDVSILTNSVGTFYPNYYEKMTDLDSMDDTTQVILPQLLEDYAISYVERVKGNETKAKQYEATLISGNINTTPKGLATLDKMDIQQRAGQGQPKSLFRFRGQRAVSRLYGEDTIANHDFIKENYFTFIPIFFILNLLWNLKIV